MLALWKAHVLLGRLVVVCVYRPWSVVYKIDYFVLRLLLSSFVLLNIKDIFCLYSRT